jgi:hypothetical protein
VHDILATSGSIRELRPGDGAIRIVVIIQLFESPSLACQIIGTGLRDLIRRKNDAVRTTLRLALFMRDNCKLAPKSWHIPSRGLT